MGFLVAFLLPALLALAAWLDQPALVVAVVFLFFPFARPLFGVLPQAGGRPASAKRSIGLDAIPFAYAVGTPLLVGWLLLALRQREIQGIDALGWTVSLWLTFVFGTCVSHVLLHSAKRGVRLVGHLLAGIQGYPILGYEHNRHHRMPGSADAAEWPYAAESLWGFAARRGRKVFAESLGFHGLAVRGDHRSSVVQGIRVGVVALLVTCAAFGLSLGWLGVAIYGGVVALVAFSIQLVTYLQHWGLSEHDAPGARQMQWGWEDDCRFQSWLTMGLSVHMAHHRDTHRPYYQLALQPDSPRMPAGYLVLMFAAFVPTVWRRVMAPATEYWRRNPQTPPSAGRGLTCAVIYRQASSDK